jgi:DNA-directed RNA polymerase
MEHAWGAWLGRLIFDDCKTSLKRPMQLLSIFEAAGKKAESEGRFLSWTVPITNFPVVQNYEEGTVKKVWTQYGAPRGPKLSTGHYTNTLQLHVCHPELPVMSKGKQAQGAAPNCIHSLDAAHLMLTTVRCDFNITTIHDSYGCLLADMPVLFNVVREAFVELYAENPLYSLMEEINGNLEGVEIGTLCIDDILESEYAFA